MMFKHCVSQSRSWALRHLVKAKLPGARYLNGGTNQAPSIRIDVPVDSILAYEEVRGMVSPDSNMGWCNLKSGVQLNDRYSVVRKLGWGINSNAWLAFDKCEEKYVSLKVYTEHFTRMWGPGLINPTELVYEPLALMKFSKSPTSPHCITRMAGGEISGDDGTPGKHTVTATPVYGGNAKQLLSALFSPGSAVPLPLVKRILLHTLRGLAHCHERGFVHTHLEPDNIFFETPLSTNNIGEVVKWDSHDGTTSLAVSQPLPMITLEDALRTNFVLGGFSHALPTSGLYRRVVSPQRLCAPEVLLRTMWSGNSVDIWSFGCLIFELITNRPLFSCISEPELPNDPVANLLYQMEVLTGEAFPEDQLHGGLYSRNYFNENGSLRSVMAHDPSPLGLRIKEYNASLEVGIPDETVDSIGGIITRCLRLDPANRPTAQELLEDPFFDDVD